jgi:hypothetical protein
MTVPFAPITDDIRHDRGFEDLRGRPDKAKEIAEGNDSPALRHLLVRVANVGSKILTVGCELGGHQDPTHVPLRRREVAGGYVQFTSIQYDRAETESYAAFANAIVTHVKACAGKDHWEIELVGQMVNFQFTDGPRGLHPSLMVWFFAGARDQFAAMQSRERLIEAIDGATALPATLEAFALAEG